MADLDEIPAGMASATAPDQNGTTELISMWVALFARGQGVGGSLIRAVMEWAQRQKAARVSLAVFEGNERAKALYQRHGFVDVGSIDNIGSAIAPERQMMREVIPEGRRASSLSELY